jgi:hypothetical protein
MIWRLRFCHHESGVCHSVIPTEAEGSRAVCGAQGRIRGPMKRSRICKDLSMRPEDGARSLDYARDDGHVSTFVQCGGFCGPASISVELLASPAAKGRATRKNGRATGGEERPHGNQLNLGKISGLTSSKVAILRNASVVLSRV